MVFRAQLFGQADQLIDLRRQGVEVGVFHGLMLGALNGPMTIQHNRHSRGRRPLAPMVLGGAPVLAWGPRFQTFRLPP
ncbi:hypothetical protein D3C72_2290220 [compost metagenome]